MSPLLRHDLARVIKEHHLDVRTGLQAEAMAHILAFHLQAMVDQALLARNWRVVNQRITGDYRAADV